MNYIDITMILFLALPLLLLFLIPPPGKKDPMLVLLDTTAGTVAVRADRIDAICPTDPNYGNSEVKCIVHTNDGLRYLCTNDTVSVAMAVNAVLERNS